MRAVVGKLHRRLRTTRAGSGLTPTQLSVLLTVARRERLGLSELAERESLNPTLVSRTVAALSEAGLVRRTSSSEDRRAGIVEATAAGRRLRERIRSEWASTIGEQLAQLPDTEQQRVLDALPALETLADGLRARP